jgi:hypothetical protein
VSTPEPTIDVRGPAARRAIRYEQATITYNIAEGVIAVTAGLVAGSIALVGFGFDSWIEVAAATVVLVRLRAELGSGQPTRPSSAARCGSSPSPSSSWRPTSPPKASATSPARPAPTPARSGSP